MGARDCRAATVEGDSLNCEALKDTDFVGECKFYKTRDRYDHDTKMIREGAEGYTPIVKEAE